MKKLVCLFCCMLGFVLTFAQTTTRDKVNAVLQKKGEAKLLIKAQEQDLELLARTVSLDYRYGEEYLAYVNKKQFERFCETGLDYRLFEDNGPKTVLMAETTDEMLSWNRYPVYGIYVEMMQDFARQYGTLCRLDTIGFSTDNRLILALACGSDVHSDQGKPKFFYSSSIHGDELLGMIMLLRLADHLLGSYQTDASARRILDSIDLFICPLANPDGAYGWNENSVTGARRYNANYVDLNRNFPDPVYGAHSDNEEYQDETLAFMDYAKKNRFDISINIHGGAEVCNYPWDCWPTDERTHPDREWFRKICSSFIDSVRVYAPSAYFTGINPEGMTDGSDWYNVFGGRQDYHNWFLRCRELTLEISNTKTPSSDMLTTYWDYLKGYQGLLGFGLEEPYISMKVYLEGGQCVLMKNIVSGHIYRTKFPYRINGLEYVYNKFMIAELLLPQRMKDYIHTYYRQAIGLAYPQACSLLEENKSYLMDLKAYYQSIFISDFQKIYEMNACFY